MTQGDSIEARLARQDSANRALREKVRARLTDEENRALDAALSRLDGVRMVTTATLSLVAAVNGAFFSIYFAMPDLTMKEAGNAVAVALTLGTVSGLLAHWLGLGWVRSEIQQHVARAERERPRLEAGIGGAATSAALPFGAAEAAPRGDEG